MPASSKKLQADSEVLRVFYIGVERKLKFVNSGATVWTHFRGAHKALLEQQQRLRVHLGLGRIAYEPLIHILFVNSSYIKRRRGSQGSQWELLRGAPVYKVVDEEEMIVLRTESA